MMKNASPELKYQIAMIGIKLLMYGVALIGLGAASRAVAGREAGEN